ncbi:MAG: hypothetical protein FJX29_09200 [Alphaproteobacteria bacterium]|nr:hypothetical protein [Alphaproteobacteria bacterium]
MPFKTMLSNPANAANPAWNPVTAVRVALALAVVGAVALVTVLAASLTAAPPAQAQSSCQNDFSIIQGKREKQIAALNAMAKRSRGKLDPAAACPRLRALAATETEMLAYMRKNKAWCSIPDELIAQVEKGRAGTQNMAGQACKVAGQIAVMKRRAAQQQRQMQQQDAATAAARPKLPSGPL